MSDERTQRAEEALNAVLKPLGTNLVHYMEVHRNAAIDAMARQLEKAVQAERERCAAIVDDYPPDAFFEVLFELTERDDRTYQSFDGDTGNWCWFMGRVLKPYVAKIRG